MKPVKIGYDKWQKKDVIKLLYNKDDMPALQVFNSNDVISGHPGSSIAIGFVYTWKSDAPPKEVAGMFAKFSNYAAITGYWKTTNGARYVFSNILSNPNINKLIILVFGQKDNGHLLVDALVNFWKNGTDKNGIIKGSYASNPKFEQVPDDALKRIRKQCDLVVMRNLKTDSYSENAVEKVIKAQFQEPDNTVSVSEFQGAEFYTNVVPQPFFYDDGARFRKPHNIDLASSSHKPKYTAKKITSSIGASVQADDIEEALENVSAFVYKNGTSGKDQRGINVIESRSLSITIKDSLAKVPSGFSEKYIKSYVDEFMHGIDKKKHPDCEAFAYTYHDRIFKKWGNQLEKAILKLKKSPLTRRALVSLWSQESDLESSSPPCLVFFWLAVRQNKLELHVVYRSHHLATITPDGRLMKGEGAFVLNMFALATLQQHAADALNLERGPLILTDFSAHLYVSGA